MMKAIHREKEQHVIPSCDVKISLHSFVFKFFKGY